MEFAVLASVSSVQQQLFLQIFTKTFETLSFFLHLFRMYTIAIFALLVASAAAGVVQPVDRCGGIGRPIQLRVTDCEGAPPCTIIPNKDYLVEGDFIAAGDSRNAMYRLTARTQKGDIVVSEGSMGAIQAGLQYTATQTVKISNALSGQRVISRITVFHSEDNLEEICVEAAMDVAY